MPDFSMTGVVNAGNADQAPSPADNLSSAFTKTAGYANETGERAKAAEQANQIEPVFNAKTGTWDLGNVPNDALQAILNNAKQFGQIQQIYQKQIDYNQQQQEGLKAHPFANALSQIAASVGASSKDPLVRGLGDAAQRLNPTLPQLQQQQQGMLKGAGEAISQQGDLMSRAATLAMASHAQGREDAREARLDRRGQQEAEEKRVKDIAHTLDQFGRDAKGLMFDPHSAAEVLRSHGVPEDKIKAEVDRYTKQQELAKQEKKATQDFELKKIQQKDDDALKKVAAVVGAQSAKGEKATAEKEQKRQDQLAKPLFKPISELRDTELALDDIEKVVKQLPDMQGPIAGNLEKMDPYRKGQVQELITKLDLALPRTIKVTGGGARAYGPMERGFFKNLSEGVQHTKEQNLAIIKDWRDFISQSRQGLYETASANGLDMGRYKKAYGRDASLLTVGDSGSGPSLDDFKEWQKRKGK